MINLIILFNNEFMLQLIMKCSICFESMNNVNKTKLTNLKKKKNKNYIKCKHKFHKKCILEWYYSNNSNSEKCPICRRDIIFQNYSTNMFRKMIKNNYEKENIEYEEDSIFNFYICFKLYEYYLNSINNYHTNKEFIKKQNYKKLNYKNNYKNNYKKQNKNFNLNYQRR